jgi:hypothetical protein
MVIAGVISSPPTKSNGNSIQIEKTVSGTEGDIGVFPRVLEPLKSLFC